MGSTLPVYAGYKLQRTTLLVVRLGGRENGPHHCYSERFDKDNVVYIVFVFFGKKYATKAK